MSGDDHPEQRIVLVRHAETAWSLTGQHTGTTDLALTDEGRRKAELIAPRVAGRSFARVLTSPLVRALETCRIVGYEGEAQVRDDLREWDYGDYEGRTTAEIRGAQPDWVLWHDGAPGGETPKDVEARVDRLVDELCAVCEDGGDVLVFAHGHVLRVLAVRWIGLPVAAGRLLELSTGTVSTLGWKREIRVIETWNDDSHLRARR